MYADSAGCSKRSHMLPTKSTNNKMLALDNKLYYIAVICYVPTKITMAW